MRNNNRIYLNFLLLPVVFIAFFVSCESEQRPEPVVPILPEVVSFSEHIIPVFEGTSIGIDTTGAGTACIKCHNGKTPPNLTAENAYIELTGGGYVVPDSPDESKLYLEIEQGGSMHKYTNEVDVAYIKKWIEQGALEN